MIRLNFRQQIHDMEVITAAKMYFNSIGIDPNNRYLLQQKLWDMSCFSISCEIKAVLYLNIFV